MLKKAFLVEHFFDLHIGIHNFRLSSTKDSLYGLTVKGGIKKKTQDEEGGESRAEVLALCTCAHTPIDMLGKGTAPETRTTVFIFSKGVTSFIASPSRLILID